VEVCDVLIDILCKLMICSFYTYKRYHWTVSIEVCDALDCIKVLI
jgi:hypothetical protein